MLPKEPRSAQYVLSIAVASYQKRRFQSLPLFAALILALCSAPFLGNNSTGTWALIITFVGLAAAGGHALLRDRLWLIVFLASVTVVVAIDFTVPDESPLYVIRVISSLGALVIYSLLFKAVLKHSFFNPDASTGDRLLAGVCGYLLVVFWWSNVFLIVEALHQASFLDPQHSPSEGSLPRFNLVYYSLVTVSTLGYGDIVPSTNWARLAGGLAGLSGTLYLAVFISAIISGLRVHAGKDR